MAKSINFLRSFFPSKVSFGTDDDMSNAQWDTQIVAGKAWYTTMFQTDEMFVKVIFSWNEQWECAELSFKTVMKSKVSSISDAKIWASYIRDIDLLPNPNRATDIFRQVVYVALAKIGSFSCVGFNGANKYLDRIYGHLKNLRYVQNVAADYGFTISSKGRDVFFNKDV